MHRNFGLTPKIKLFRANLRGVADKKFFRLKQNFRCMDFSKSVIFAMEVNEVVLFAKVVNSALAFTGQTEIAVHMLN